MLQYEKRLQQITNNTTQTVCKVDKIGEALKRFIEVKMVTESEEHKKDLKNIVEFLDEEENTELQTKKYKPSPDSDSVLGGKGSKK